MRFSRLSILTLALAAAFTFAVDPADARVGGGKSQGSRGGQTFNPAPPTPTTPKPVAPIGRSMTEPGAPSKVQAAGRPGPVPPFALRRVRRMLMGGLLGAGLFRAPIGQWPLWWTYRLCLDPGLLLQVALIGGIAWLVVNYLRRRNQPAPARAPANLMSSTSPRDLLNRFRQTLMSNGGSAASGTPALAIGPRDYDAFERLLREIQNAYGLENTEALGAMTTPEMFSYFSQDLAENARNGRRNELSGMKLLQGDLSEAWREAGSDYATVAMRYSLVDAMIERATDSVVSGDRVAPREVTEVWTFRRDDRDPDQGWQLSAIQQT